MRKVIILLALIVSVLGCKKDEEDKQLSPAEQEKVDDQKTLEYLETHKLMFDDFGSHANNINWKIEEIAEDDGEDTESLMELMGENIIVHNKDGVDYKIYYFIIDEGKGVNPAEDDWVQLDYSGYNLDNSRPFDSTMDKLSHVKFDLQKLIVGMKVGIPTFKTGIKPEGFPGDYKVDQYRENIDTPGRGFLIMPSGVAYGPNGSGSIYPNSVLRFDIVLYHNVPIEEDKDE